MDQPTPIDANDLLATRAMAVGIGLLVLMLAWLVGNRIAQVFWEAPTGPVVAFASAIISGIVGTFIGFRRLITTYN